MTACEESQKSPAALKQWEIDLDLEMLWDMREFEGAD